MVKRCTVYDQITDRTCRYDEGHGGRHRFPPLDHDSSLERELRRRLDLMTKIRDDACELALRVLRGQESLESPHLRWFVAHFEHLRAWDESAPALPAETRS